MTPTERIRELRRTGKHEEACALAVDLAARRPADSAVQYETACVHDFLGREGKAVQYYVAAISGYLPLDELRGAYLGLGSTYRVLGRFAESEQTLLAGLTHFPAAPELETFLAMTLHNLGRSKEAVQMLLRLLASSSSDSNIQEYKKAIAFYATDIDKTWSE